MKSIADILRTIRWPWVRRRTLERAVAAAAGDRRDAERFRRERDQLARRLDDFGRHVIPLVTAEPDLAVEIIDVGRFDAGRVQTFLDDGKLYTRGGLRRIEPRAAAELAAFAGREAARRIEPLVAKAVAEFLAAREDDGPLFGGDDDQPAGGADR